jgi:hypothetical protein
MELVRETGFAEFIFCELQESVRDVDCEGGWLLVGHGRLLRCGGVDAEQRGGVDCGGD